MPVVTPLVYPWSIKHETFNCPLVRPTSCLQIHKQEVTNNALPFADARIVLRDYILGSTRTHWLDATPNGHKHCSAPERTRTPLPTSKERRADQPGEQKIRQAKNCVQIITSGCTREQALEVKHPSCMRVTRTSITPPRS